MTQRKQCYTSGFEDKGPRERNAKIYEDGKSRTEIQFQKITKGIILILAQGN